jgi:hypothetical protein
VNKILWHGFVAFQKRKLEFAMGFWQFLELPLGALDTPSSSGFHHAKIEKEDMSFNCEFRKLFEGSKSLCIISMGGY